MSQIRYTKELKKRNREIFNIKTLFILFMLVQLQSAIVYYKCELETSPAEVSQYIFENFTVFFNPFLFLPL